MSEPVIGCRLLGGQPAHEAGRQLLQRLYLEHTGKKCPEILVTDRGKPYFADNSLHFSISHTNRHVFCVLSEKNVGIDAEEMNRRVPLHLARKILSPSEQVRFAAAADKNAALLRLWVLKEAAAKLTGQGLRGYPNGTDFDPADCRVREMDGCYVAVLEEGEDHAL